MTMVTKTRSLTLEQLDERGWEKAPAGYGRRIVISPTEIYISIDRGHETASGAKIEDQLCLDWEHNNQNYDSIPPEGLMEAQFPQLSPSERRWYKPIILRWHPNTRSESAEILSGGVYYIALINGKLSTQIFEAPAVFFTIQADKGKTGDPHVIFSPSGAVVRLTSIPVEKLTEIQRKQ